MRNDSYKEYRVIVYDSRIEWRFNNLRHRERGPAVINNNGNNKWFYKGKLHREGGPALYADGNEFWYRHGNLHREDGPACEYADGRRIWCLNNLIHSEKSWKFVADIIKKINESKST